MDSPGRVSFFAPCFVTFSWEATRMWANKAIPI